MFPAAAKGEVTKKEWIQELGVCESGGRADIKHLDSNGYFSYGLLQFQLGTWLSYGKYLHSSKENIYNVGMQMSIAAKMLDNGESYHWKNCAKKVTRKLGSYPKGE